MNCVHECPAAGKVDDVAYPSIFAVFRDFAACTYASHFMLTILYSAYRILLTVFRWSYLSVRFFIYTDPEYLISFDAV